MKVLVCGGAGYIGSHTAKLLADEGHEPVILDDLSRGHRKAVGDMTLIEADLGNAEIVSSVLRRYRIDTVMHFAAFAYVGESVEKPLMYYRNNVAKTVNLLKAMMECDVRRFIFSSSCATYGIPSKTPITEDEQQKPINPYGRTKLMVEQILADMAATEEIGYAALRYFNAAGASLRADLGEDHDPETHLIPVVLQVAQGRREKVVIFGDDYETPDGTCIRDYIHVDDLAEAHILAARQLEPGKRLQLNLGTGRGYSVRQVIDAAAKVTGREIRTEIGPRRPGDPPVLFADPSRAKKMLGWQPQTPELEEIIASAWRWMQKHPHGYKDS